LIYSTDGKVKNTARLLLAVAKIDDKGEVIDAMVFSIYSERAGQGISALWLSEFLKNNQDLIGNLLNLKEN